jgi:hypothetical protein
MGARGGEAGGVRWQVRGTPDRALLQRLGELAGRADAGWLTPRKLGRRKGLFEVALGPDAAADHLLKTNRYLGLQSVWRRLRGSKARRELRVAEAVAARGIATPLPLACGERIAGGRLHGCYLVVPRLDGVADLGTLSREASLPVAERRQLARAFGDFARRVHDAGLWQDDFAPNNFLVRLCAAPELLAIDFERAHLRRRPPGTRSRRHALAKLDRRLPHARNSERWRFLLAYARGERETARAWWRALGDYAPRLAARDLARLRRRIAREGRSSRRVRAAGALGFARREVSVAALLSARATPPGTWALPTPWGRRAREGWALAHLLWLRGLGPKPLACLERAGRATLYLERAAGAHTLAEASDPGMMQVPLERALGRLLALGRLDPALGAGDLAVAPGPGGAPEVGLLAATRLCVGRAGPRAGRRAEAARRARALLDPARG